MTYSFMITLYNQIKIQIDLCCRRESNPKRTKLYTSGVKLKKNIYIYIYIFFEKKYKSIIAVKSPRPASPKKSQFSESGSAVTKKQDSIIAVDLSL